MANADNRTWGVFRRGGAVAGLLAVCLPGVAAGGSAVWVTADDYAAFHVVVSKNAEAEVRAAADEFRALWERTTGYEITSGVKPVSGKVNVWIGLKDAPYVDRRELAGLGEDEMFIRTTSRRTWPKRSTLTSIRRASLPLESRHLVLTGGSPETTREAVREFFRRYVGAVIPASGEATVPRAPESFPPIRFRHATPSDEGDMAAVESAAEGAPTAVAP